MTGFKEMMVGLLFISGTSMAQCRHAGESTELSGTFVREETTDSLLLDAPLTCVGAERGQQLTRMTLRFSGERPGPEEIPDDSEVLVDGVFDTGVATGEARVKVTDIISLEDDTPGDPPMSAADKTALVEAFTHFQQAVRDRDSARLATYLAFPVAGETAPFLGERAAHLAPGEADAPLTASRYRRYQREILEALQPLAGIRVDVPTLRFDEYRLNALTPAEQAREYSPDPEDEESWYYQENGKRHRVGGVCDRVSNAMLYDTALMVTIGMDANLTLPGSAERCEFQDIFFFTLVNGEMKLVNATSAG